MKSVVWGEEELIALRRKGKRPADPILLGVGVRRLNVAVSDMVVLSVDRGFRVAGHDWWYLSHCDIVVCGYREDAFALATAGAYFKTNPAVNFLGVWLVDEGGLHELFHRKGGGFITRCSDPQWWHLMDWQKRIIKRQPEDADAGSEFDTGQHRLAAVPCGQGNPQGHQGQHCG